MIRTSRIVATLTLLLGGGLIAQELPASGSTAGNSVLHLVYTSSTIGYVDACG